MSMFHRIRRAFALYRFASADARTPTAAKVLPWLSLLYLIWPIDILPDLIPILGQADDIGVIIALCIFALKMIPSDVRKDSEKIIDIEPRR